MLRDVISVKPLANYELRVTFDDGVEGVIDVAEMIQFTARFGSIPSSARSAGRMPRTSTPTFSTPRSRGSRFRNTSRRNADPAHGSDDARDSQSL